MIRRVVDLEPQRRQGRPVRDGLLAFVATLATVGVGGLLISFWLVFAMLLPVVPVAAIIWLVWYLFF